MHELSITQAIVSIVLRKALEADAARITRVDLRIGQLAGIIPECVELQFALLSRGTIAEDAVLSFDTPPLTLKCRTCNATYTREDVREPCPCCGGAEIDIISGFELSVQSIEID